MKTSNLRNNGRYLIKDYRKIIYKISDYFGFFQTLEYLNNDKHRALDDMLNTGRHYTWNSEL